MTASLILRPVEGADLLVFFEQQRDPEAVHMAAFTVKDPADWEAFQARWRRILADSTVHIRTILSGGEIAGSVLSYEMEQQPEVSYWLGRQFWGQGIATRALSAFLEQVNRTRPIYARAAKDNLASLRVLQKCGFTVTGEDWGYANARSAEIAEFILVLNERIV